MVNICANSGRVSTTEATNIQTWRRQAARSPASRAAISASPISRTSLAPKPALPMRSTICATSTTPGVYSTCALAEAKLTLPAITPGVLASTPSMPAAQAAQLMPVISSATVSGGTEKPALSSVSTRACGWTWVRSYCSCTRSLAKLTVALTPGCLLSSFSIVVAHAAQVMPRTGKFNVVAAA